MWKSHKTMKLPSGLQVSCLYRLQLGCRGGSEGHAWWVWFGSGAPLPSSHPSQWLQRYIQGHSHKTEWRTPRLARWFVHRVLWIFWFLGLQLCNVIICSLFCPFPGGGVQANWAATSIATKTSEKATLESLLSGTLSTSLDWTTSLWYWRHLDGKITLSVK